MDREARTIQLIDEIAGGNQDIRLGYHLGPDVRAVLDNAVVSLTWSDGDMPRSAVLELPDELNWSLHRGEISPILGWYSAGLGHRVPAFTLLGQGRYTTDLRLMTVLSFGDSDQSGQAIPLRTFNAASTTPGTHAEGR
jgi:hypothetical protein